MSNHIERLIRTPREPGVVGFLRRAAEVCFAMFLETAEWVDGLPLENRHTLKTLLVKAPTLDAKLREMLFKDDVELARILTSAGWWVLERDITGPIQRDILNLGREGRHTELDLYLCRMFNEDGFSRLERKVASWFDIPYMNARRDLIQQSLVAHKEGRYFLSIAALLPLLDGLTRSFRRQVLHRGAAKPTARGPRPKTIEVMLVAAYYLRNEPDLWGRPFADILNRLVFGRFKFGSGPPPNSLNRHAILHGETADYGTEANSLKVFLLLDTLQHFYGEVRREKVDRARRKVAAPPQRPAVARITVPTPTPR